MTSIVVISKNLDALERRILVKNLSRFERVFGVFSLVYVLGDYDDVGFLENCPECVRFLRVRNSRREQSAALSRGIGYSFLSPSLNDLVLFLDGDMLVTEDFLRFLRSTEEGPLLAQCDRLDIRCASGLSRRKITFRLAAGRRFKSLYGCMAVRGINFLNYNLMTHDLEEQWFLRLAKDCTADHMEFPRTGILHFDRFSGMSRIRRLFQSSRGIGLWQGLLRDADITRIIHDLVFLMQGRRGFKSKWKFVCAAALSLPKLVWYRVPRNLDFEEVMRRRS